MIDTRIYLHIRVTSGYGLVVRRIVQFDTSVDYPFRTRSHHLTAMHGTEDAEREYAGTFDTCRSDGQEFLCDPREDKTISTEVSKVASCRETEPTSSKGFQASR